MGGTWLRIWKRIRKKILAYFNEIPSLSSFEHEIGGIFFHNYNETVLIEPRTEHTFSYSFCVFVRLFGEYEIIMRLKIVASET